MKCVQCNNPEVTAIFAEGGGIAAYYCPRCGARSQFPTCSDGCAKKAAQARAKERQATQKKAEKKAARR